MIKQLIWTIWTPMFSVPKKADKLNLSLSLSPLEGGNYQGLKLSDQVMKVLKRVAENFFRITNVHGWNVVWLYACGHGTTNAIFIARYVTCVWWAFCKLGIGEWLVCLIQNIYENARSIVHVGCDLSGEFSMKVDSCLSPLLLIMVLKTLSQEFHLYRTSLGKPVCRWPGHHLWITGGNAREANPLED